VFFHNLHRKRRTGAIDISMDRVYLIIQLLLSLSFFSTNASVIVHRQLHQTGAATREIRQYRALKPWVPAFAGMTIFALSCVENPSDFARRNDDGVDVRGGIGRSGCPGSCGNLPPGLRPEDNEAGSRISLEQLARRFE